MSDLALVALGLVVTMLAAALFVVAWC